MLEQTVLRQDSELPDILNQIGRALLAELDLHKIVQAVTDVATRLTGAQLGAFFYNVVDAQDSRPVASRDA